MLRRILLLLRRRPILLHEQNRLREFQICQFSISCFDNAAVIMEQCMLHRFDLKRGLGGKDLRAGKDDYYYPINIMSKDSDGMMRVGMLSACRPPRSRKQPWTGTVSRELFSRTWNSSEDVIGKTVYLADWQSDLRVDQTHDERVVRVGRAIGNIVKHFGLMAFVDLENDFTRSDEFREDGVWMTEMTKETTRPATMRERVENCQPFLIDRKLACRTHPRRA